MVVFGKCDSHQTTAIIEHTFADACYASGYLDTRQIGAIFKRRITDACKLAVFAEHDTRQTTAIFKRIITDASQLAVFGKPYTSQIFVPRKCLGTYAGNAVRNNEISDQFTVKIQILGIVQRI